MGEARKRRGFRVIDGGKALRSQPPRLITHTLLIEQPGHDAIEEMRVKTGMASAHDFDLFLMGAGLGVIEVPHFIVAFNRYVTEIEKMRKGDPSIPQATIQQFSGMVVRIGMGEIIRAAKTAQVAPDAAAPVVTDRAVTIHRCVQCDGEDRELDSNGLCSDECARLREESVAAHEEQGGGVAPEEEPA
jgi:hypothetical protein